MSAKFVLNKKYSYFREVYEFVKELSKEFYLPNFYSFSESKFHICDFELKLSDVEFYNIDECNKLLNDILDLVTINCITVQERRKIFSGTWISSRTLNERNM